MKHEIYDPPTPRWLRKKQSRRRRAKASTSTSTASPLPEAIPRNPSSSPPSRRSDEEPPVDDLTETTRALMREFAECGDVDGLEALLERFGQHLIGFVDRNGRTLLSYAAGNGRLDMTSYLVEVWHPETSHASYHQKRDKWGRSALSWAAGNGHLDVVMLLLSH